MSSRSVLVAAAFAAVFLAAAAPGRASEQFGDVDVAFELLQVNANGEALVAYRTSAGVLRHVYVWGAINAIPPDPSRAQVRFRYDYSGGWRKSGRQTWRTFRDACRPYVDSFNSVFGVGWRHDAGKVAHSRNGAFCYSFVPQYTPAGYPKRELRPPGNGERHRVTVMGPGVTPVLQWEGAGLGRYDAQLDASFNVLFDRIVGPDDRVCVPER